MEPLPRKMQHFNGPFQGGGRHDGPTGHQRFNKCLMMVFEGTED